jgi:hypothetical protein
MGDGAFVTEKANQPIYPDDGPSRRKFGSRSFYALVGAQFFEKAVNSSGVAGLD